MAKCPTCGHTLPDPRPPREQLAAELAEVERKAHQMIGRGRDSWEESVEHLYLCRKAEGLRRRLGIQAPGAERESMPVAPKPPSRR